MGMGGCEGGRSLGFLQCVRGAEGEGWWGGSKRGLLVGVYAIRHKRIGVIRILYICIYIHTHIEARVAWPALGQLKRRRTVWISSSRKNNCNVYQQRNQ